MEGETGGEESPEEDDLPAQASDFDLFEAIEYAVAQGSDIIVMSLVDETLQEAAWMAASAGFMEEPVNHNILGGPNCGQTNVHVLHVDQKTFTAMMLPSRDWWATVDLGPKSSAFVSAGNCQLNWDNLFLENPIAEYLDPQRTVIVGAMQAFPTNEEPLHLSPAIAPNSALGKETVDVATMTEIYALAGQKRSVNLFRGTSCAAPHAAGIYAQFLIARLLGDPDYLEDSGSESAIQEFFGAAVDSQRPTPGMGDGTVFLDAGRATVMP